MADPDDPEEHTDLLGSMLAAANEPWRATAADLAGGEESPKSRRYTGGSHDRTPRTSRKSVKVTSDYALTTSLISDNLLTFMFGGFDTTSITLAYAMYELAMHPVELARLRKEVDSVVKESARACSYYSL